MTNAVPIPDSGDQNIDALTVSNRWETTDPVTFGIPTSAGQYGDNAYTYVSGGVTYQADETVGFVAPDPAFVEAVRDAMALIEEYTLLELEELEDSPGDAVIRAGITTTPKPTSVSPTAYAVGPKDESDPLYHTAGDAWFDQGGAAEVGTVRYTIVLHEMGHTVGLNDVNVWDSDTGTQSKPMEAEFQSLEFSIMSYTGFIGATGNGMTTPSGHAPQSYMMWDIATLQFIYGADFTTRGGDTTYRFDPATGEMSIDGVGQGQPTQNILFRTVWDGNGTDTYDFSDYTTALDVDLAPGEWTDVDRFSDFQAADMGGGPNGGYARGQVANAMLYQGDTRSLIENATGGSGHDVIGGNQAGNLLLGGAGIDTLRGHGGEDTLDQGAGGGRMEGGDGNDSLVAGGGADEAIGGAGTDRMSYLGSTGGVVANLGTGTGAFHWAQGDTYSGVEHLDGSHHADTITGDNQANGLLGWGGNDLLSGAQGADVLSGGEGNDTLNGGGGADQLIGGTGTDTARYGGAVSLNLTTGVHTGEAQGDSFSSIERFEGGNAGADTMTGSAGGEVLDGRGGDDWLYGLGGNDTLIGGAGNDAIDGGSGADLVDYGLAGAAVEVNLAADIAVGASIGGDALISVENVSGSAANDTIRGDEGVNALSGNGGNDSLTGAEGADTLSGGSGNDTIAGGAGDSIVGGIGTDVLRLTGTPAIVNLATGLHGGGMAGASIAGVERIEGTGGGDILIAGRSGVTLAGQGGADSLTGDRGGDTLLGGGANDSLSGFAGGDLLEGGAGADVMDGGSGPDVFRWAAGDVGALVPAGGGMDTILGFDLAEDRLDFGDGFFFDGFLGGEPALSEVLQATAAAGGGAAILSAHTEVAGWRSIARLEGVSARALSEMIEDESILAAPAPLSPPDGGGLIG